MERHIGALVLRNMWSENAVFTGWLQEPIADEANGAAGGRDLRQGVTALMDVMRDLLNSIRFIPPPVENPQDDDMDGAADDDDDDDDDGNWQ